MTSNLTRTSSLTNTFSFFLLKVDIGDKLRLLDAQRFGRLVQRHDEAVPCRRYVLVEAVLYDENEDSVMNPCNGMISPPVPKTPGNHGRYRHIHLGTYVLRRRRS